MSASQVDIFELKNGHKSSSDSDVALPTAALATISYKMATDSLKLKSTKRPTAEPSYEPSSLQFDSHRLSQAHLRSEPILQIRTVIMIAVYLGSLSAGFASSMIAMNRPSGHRAPEPLDWTDNVFMLGGLIGSGVLVSLLLRFVGRIKSTALVSLMLFVSCVMSVVSNDDDLIWMKRVTDFLSGLAVGVQLPTQFLLAAETSPAKHRTQLIILHYVMLNAGDLLAQLLATVLQFKGLAILSCLLLLAHFVLVGFFHPETPRFLFCVKDKKAECVNSLQWLRGEKADIGMEYADMADTSHLVLQTQPWCSMIFKRRVIQPLVTSTTLMTLTSLSGLLTITKLLKADFYLAEPSGGLLITYAVSAANVVVPVLCALLLIKYRRKSVLRPTILLMTVSLLFLAGLLHFQPEFSARHPWILHCGGFLFSIGHQLGLGPLSWVFMCEITPSFIVEFGVALSASAWWAFGLLFSVTHQSLFQAIGLSGLCVLHSVVSGLTYAFVTLALPEIYRGSSLQDVQRYYSKLVQLGLFMPTDLNESESSYSTSSI